MRRKVILNSVLLLQIGEITFQTRTYEGPCSYSHGQTQVAVVIRPPVLFFKSSLDSPSLLRSGSFGIRNEGVSLHGILCEFTQLQAIRRLALLMVKHALGLNP